MGILHTPPSADNGDSHYPPREFADCGFELKPAPVKSARRDGRSSRRTPAFLRPCREYDEAMFVNAVDLAWACHLVREGLR